ncbi:MAG: hypothetical protein M1820_003896 [Bogoriella megaspora]|nr:MAG: hypothetical protein M1820_003896 [Bogoriella megaspora]
MKNEANYGGFSSATGSLKQGAELHKRFGSTYRDPTFFGLSIKTKDTENIHAVFGYRSREWGVGPFRLAAMAPFCGEGLLTTDGAVWEHSRALLKPAFHKESISDLSAFEVLFGQILARVPRDGSTIDLQPLLMSLFVDTSATFLLGEPLGVLGNSRAPGATLDGIRFQRHFMLSLRAVGMRLRMGFLRFRVPEKESVTHWRLVHNFIDFFADRAIKRASEEQSIASKSLIDALAKQSNDQKVIRTQTIQAMMGAADTTPLLISNAVFLLSRNPKVFADLRSEVANITSKPMTLEDTKQSSLLRNIIRESLRLYPIFPTLARVALVDTVLPRGGGSEGNSPIFAPTGTRVLSNFFSLHRDESVFGPNAESFDPSRWNRISPGPFEYMAFGAGQRACLGRQKAIAEASIALIRIAQNFTRIESRDDQLWCGEQRMVCMNVNGHEAGHGAFSPSDTLNNTVGWILHSFMLTPYFSWRSTHRRHHIYANNMAEDHNYVPPQREEYANTLGVDISRVEELTEDAPIVTLLRIVLQQAIGFPWYLLTNITASDTSLPGKKSSVLLGNSHIAPYGSLFRPDEAHVIILSDIGLALMIGILHLVTHRIGLGMVALLYVQPYIWLNHWIVAITYLHHTHPDLPKYEEDSWTFLKGATSTVDREFGFIGKHIFHSIIEFHVIHHLFPKIPFYHAEEATKAIIPLLGHEYHSDKKRAFLGGLWESFTKCQWVEPDESRSQAKKGMLWYKGGPSPPPEYSMRLKGISKLFRINAWMNMSTSAAKNVQ